MLKITAFFFIFFAAVPARAGFVWMQNGWQGGAVSGSTTNASTGWTNYDSAEGDIVIPAGAPRLQPSIGRIWTQTDNGTGASGFNLPGAVFSTTAVTGAGAVAGIAMSPADSVSPRTMSLLQTRGDIVTINQGGTGYIWLLGGLNADGSPAKDILRYEGRTDDLQSISNLKGFVGEAAGVYHSPFDTLFVIGGSSNSQAQNSIYSWTPSINSTIKRGAVLPSSRTLPSAAFVPDGSVPNNGKIYVFGGIDGTGGFLDDIVQYFPAIETAIKLTTALPTPRYGTAAALLPETTKVYIFGGTDAGGDLDEILEYDPIAGTVTVMGATLPSPRRKVSVVYDPAIAKFILFGGLAGAALDDILLYDAVADTLTVSPSILPSARSGMGVALDSSTARIYGFGASSGSIADFDEIIEYVAYSSGTYASKPFDTGNLSDLGAISWNPAAQFDPVVGLGLGFRAGDTPVPDASWTNAGAVTPVSNGGSLNAFSDHRYVQYVASFTRTEISTSAILEDLTITYTQTAASSTLVSNAFDTGQIKTVLQALRWEGTFVAGTTAHFQVRTASDNGSGFPGTFTSWLGPTGPGDFYTDPFGRDVVNPLHNDGLDDRFIQYRAALFSTNTFSTPVLSSVTLQYNFAPSSPTLDTPTALTTTSIEVRFTDDSISENEFLISYGPIPDTYIGVSSVTTADQAGTGAQLVGVVDAFSPNQLVFFSVRAHVLPPDDLFSSTDTGTEGSAFTLANPPNNPSIDDVYVTSLTLSWGKNGNANNTPYEISLSTDDFATIVSTPVLFTDNWTQTTTTLLSLERGTTYYARVRAQNGATTPTAFAATVSTHTPPLDLTGLTITEIGITSITWSWNTSGPAAQYRIFNPTTSVVIATVAVNSFTPTTLSTNALSSIIVEPFNTIATASSSTAVSTYTHAAEPAGLAVTFNSTDTITVDWSPSHNPAGTPYELLRSTDDFVADISTPIAFSDNFTSTSTTLYGLQPGTTYYFKVRARSAVFLPTDYDGPISSPTLPTPLSAPTVADIGITSITWSWTNTGGPSVSRYDLYLASGTGASNDESAVVRGVTATSLTETGHRPNSRHVLQVAPVNTSGAGRLSPATTIFTLANPPAASTVTAVFVTSMTLTWDNNLNTLLFTTYEIAHSTDGAVFSPLASYSLTGDSATTTVSALSLVGLTTHYFRVRALNNAGTPTAYGTTVNAYLTGNPPKPPGSLAAQSLSGARIGLGWTISPSTTVVRYSIYYDNGTGTIDYTVLLASVSGETTSYVTSPLTDGTTYLFGLRARDGTGLEEENVSVAAAAVALSTPFAVGARIISPAGSGLTLTGDHLSIVAEQTRGSPSQLRQILFQYRLSGSPTWFDIAAQEANHPNPAVSRPYSVHWDVTSLPAGSYNLQAVARDAAGVDDPAPAVLTLLINLSDWDIDERAVAGGAVQKRVRVRNTVPIEMLLTDPGGAVLTRITIASGALNSEQTYLRVVSSPVITREIPASFANPGIFREITLESGQTVLSDNRTATIGFSRLDRDANNRVDGTDVRVDNLGIFVYDAASGVWKRDFASGVEPDDDFTVVGRTPHFSLFGVFSPSSDDLSKVRVYPVPYKPNNGVADEGKPYQAGDSTSGILFDNLTTSSKISVYTVNGSLVWESGAIRAGGIYQWDVRNGDGRDVASGVYFAVITGDGEEAVVRTIAIVR